MPLRRIGHISDPQFAALAQGGAGAAVAAPPKLRKIGTVNDPQFAALRPLATVAPQPDSFQPWTDRRGNIHAEDRPTAPYQPLAIPEGGAVRGVGQDWYALNADQAAAALEQEQMQAQRAALPQSSVPFLQAVRGQTAAGLLDTAALVQRAGITTEEPTLLSPGGDADALHRMATVARGTANLQAERSWMPTTARVTSQAVGTLAKTIPLAVATGPAGVIAEAALTRSSQAVQEGRDAGLSGWDLARYSATSGVIEGGTTAAFQGLARVVPGIGGLENIGSKPVAATAREVLKKLAVGTVGELAEEEAITVLDALNQTAEGVDPRATENLGAAMKETALVTLATMGLANTVQGARWGVERFAARNPEIAQKVAALPDQPSRKQMAEAGIDTAAAPSTAQERADLVKETRAALAAVEAWNEPEMQRMAASMTEDEFVKAAPKPDRSDPGMTFERLAASLPKEETGEYAPQGPGGIERAVMRLVKGNPGIDFAYKADEAKSNQSDSVVFYDDTGEPAGALRVHLDENGNPQLLSIAVKPEHQGKGIGKKLFEKARERYPDIDSASGAGGYTEEGARFAYRRLRAQSESLPVAKVAPEETVAEQPTPETTEPYSGISGFVTAQGSTYVRHEDGTTTRTKAPRPGHDVKDVGEKERSNATYFVSPDAAREIGMWQTSSATGKRIVIENGKAVLVSINPKTGKHGVDGRFELSSKPTIGLHPLELWDKNEKGWYRKNHPGSAITSISGTTNAPQAEVPPSEQAAVEQPPTQTVAPEPEPPLNRTVEAGVRSRYREQAGVELGEFVDPAPEHAEAVEFMRSRGKKLRFFTNDTPDVAPGFHDGATDTVYLHTALQGDTLWYAVGHEYAHASGADDRLADLPKSIIEEAKAQYWEGAAEPYKKKLAADDKLFTQEAVAKYMGEFLRSPENRARLQAEKPTLWRKIVAAIKKLIGSPKTKAEQRVLDELRAEAAPQALPATPGTSQNLPGTSPAPPDVTERAESTERPDRYAQHTGYANPHRGTAAGEAIEAFREGQGAKPQGEFSVEAVARDAQAKFDTNAEAAAAEAAALLARDDKQPLGAEQIALVEIAAGRAADEALQSGDFSKLTAMELAIERKRKAWGEAGLAMRENLFDTPQGRLRLMVRELSLMTTREARALENAKAELRRLGGSPEGKMLDSVRLADAWHGSPHDFERFTTEKVGAGEGNQSEGWGLYFTGKKEIAEHYRDVLSKKQNAGRGLLYQVDLKPAEDEYLLWDKPVSEQSVKVQKALERLGHTDKSMDGRQIYSAQQADIASRDYDPFDISDESMKAFGEARREASLALLGAGIRGIKYLNGESRQKGEGGYNYVIFDDADVELKVKLADALKASSTVAEVQAVVDANLGGIGTDEVNLWRTKAGARIRAQNAAEKAKGTAGYVQAKKALALARKEEEAAKRDAINAARLAVRKNKPITAVVESRTEAERDLLKVAGRGSPAQIAKAAQRVKRLQDRFARRDRIFRERMERKGVIPTTPEALQAVLDDADATRRMVRELIAHKNLMRGGLGTNAPVGILGATDAAFEFTQSMVLGPVASFARDFIGTPVNYLANRVLADLPTAISNAALRAASGGKWGREGAQIEEFVDTLKTFWTSGRMWREALSNASRSFVQEDSILDRLSGKTGNTLEIERGSYAIPGLAGRVVRAPGYGTRRFGDDFTRTIVAHLAAVARARRAAVELGLTGDAAKQVMQAEYDNRDSYAWRGEADDTGNRSGGAYDVANEMAFQEEGGRARKTFVKGALAARRALPGARWEFRFFKTLVNLGVQMTKFTPLGAIGVVAKAAQNQMAGHDLTKGIKPDVFKASVGFLLMYAMSGMFEEDEREGEFGITGSSHATNPRSLRFGDTYVDYSQLWPLGPALLAVADATLNYKRKGASTENLTALATGVYKAVTETTIGRGLRDLEILGRATYTAATTGDYTHVENAGKLLLDQQRQTFELRPLTQFSDAASEELPFERRRREAAERAGVDYYKTLNRFDVWGNRKDTAVFGDPVGDYIEKLLYGAKVEHKPLHPGDKMIGRWNAVQTDPEKLFKAPDLDPNYVKNGKKQRMSTEQFARYAEQSGKLNAALFEASGFDVENPTAAQMKALRDNMLKARERAKELLLEGKDVDPAAEAKLLQQARLRTLQADARSGFEFKRQPGETAAKYRERQEKWRTRKTTAVAELRRLRGA